MGLKIMGHRLQLWLMRRQRHMGWATADQGAFFYGYIPLPLAPTRMLYRSILSPSSRWIDRSSQTAHV